MTEKTELIVQDSAEKTGNTKKSSQPRQCRLWCFTWNNYPKDAISTLKEVFKFNRVEYGFGEEIGEKCETPHLQGWISFEKRNRPTSLKLPKQIHWECGKGDKNSNIDYCNKDGLYHTNVEDFDLGPEDILESKQLYKWQKDVIEIIKNKPDTRKIYWFWEPKGCVGKTTFCKYLTYLYNAVPLEGKKNDVLFCAASFPSLLYVWDIERDMEEHMRYGALEKVKNGYYMSAKYESKPINRKIPHIICFANFEPDISKLSADRWVIINIGNIDNNLEEFKIDFDF